MCRSHDGQLLVVSSTDGYCTLITFSENELGTVYKKSDVVASPVKPVCPAVECLPIVETATRKEPAIAQTASVTELVCRDSSPQRKKARRVVLQTLSTNLAEITQIPRETTAAVSVTGASKKLVGDEVMSSNIDKCPPVTSLRDTASSMPDMHQADNFSELASENEAMDICQDVHDAKVRVTLYLPSQIISLHQMVGLCKQTR